MTYPKLQTCRIVFFIVLCIQRMSKLMCRNWWSCGLPEGFINPKEATYSTDLQLGNMDVKLLIDPGLFPNDNFEKWSKDTVVNKPVNIWKRSYITLEYSNLHWRRKIIFVVQINNLKISHTVRYKPIAREYHSTVMK